MAEPPGLQELADEIGLNLKKLKMVSNKFMAILFMGFYLITKWISPENYLTVDLIMNEVGLKIGYSTGSHFIAAFKKICYYAKKILNVNKSEYVINHWFYVLNNK
jgi:AraC-like DNA-binding protein